MRDIGVTGVQTCALPIYPKALTRGRGRMSPHSARASAIADPRGGQPDRAGGLDRKSVVSGKSVDLGGPRLIKTKSHIRLPCPSPPLPAHAPRLPSLPSPV